MAIDFSLPDDALGYSADTKLESMLRQARSARLVDGTDEVHLTQICRLELLF